MGCGVLGDDFCVEGKLFITLIDPSKIFSPFPCVKLTCVGKKINILQIRIFWLTRMGDGLSVLSVPKSAHTFISRTFFSRREIRETRKTSGNENSGNNGLNCFLNLNMSKVAPIKKTLFDKKCFLSNVVFE